MRASIVLAFVLLAGVGHAEDPLESLNTVQDTLATMQSTLHSRELALEQITGGGQLTVGRNTTLMVQDLDECFISRELLETEQRPSDPERQSRMCCTLSIDHIPGFTRYYWTAAPVAPHDPGLVTAAPENVCQPLWSRSVAPDTVNSASL